VSRTRRRFCLGLDQKDQFASNTPEDVAVKRRPLTEALAKTRQRLALVIGCVSSLRCKISAHRLKQARTRGFRTSMQSSACHAGRSSGGARRDRTDDLMLAKHALSQLSYGPVRGRRTNDGRHICRPSFESWWAWEDLNFRPHAYQARALTN
jgi:hypothetical protein